MKSVEMFGLPGSGKSALTQAVASRNSYSEKIIHRVYLKGVTMQAFLQTQTGLWWQLAKIFAKFSEFCIIDICWQKTRYALIAQFMSEYPSLISFMLDCTRKANPPEWISRDKFSPQKLIAWFLDIGTFYYASLRYLDHHDILLQEEGFCQHAYYLLAYYPTENPQQLLETYLQLIPQPESVIFVETLPEECELRMQQRSKGISSKILRVLPQHQRLELLRQRWQMYHQIARYFEAHQFPVLWLKNENLEDARYELRKHLRMIGK